MLVGLCTGATYAIVEDGLAKERSVVGLIVLGHRLTGYMEW